MTRAPLATLGKAPNLLSLSRIPLAVAFPLSRGEPRRGMLVLVLAGLSDVLDGWSARKLGQHTELGQIIDPIADKVFMTSVVGTLVLTGQLPAWGVPPLFAREAFEILAAGYVFTQDRPPEEPCEPRQPTIAGKLTTFAQFAAATSAVVAPRLLKAALAVAGVLGLAAGAQYAARELRTGGAP